MPPGLGPLPIVVGVTGHRDLRPQDHAELRTQVGGLFTHLRTLYPHTPLVVLSSLAEGADRLAADDLLARVGRPQVFGLDAQHGCQLGGACSSVPTHTRSRARWDGRLAGGP